jgi:hypothetical protein
MMKNTTVFGILVVVWMVVSSPAIGADPEQNCGRLKTGDNFNRINEILDCIESKIRVLSSKESLPPKSEPLVSPPPAGKVEPYRIKAIYPIPSNVEFTVFVNDVQVGAYSSNGAIADITRFIKPGQNKIRITWTADPDMLPGNFASLIIEVQQGETWHPLITRQVTKTTKAGESTPTIVAGTTPQ